MSIPGKFRPLEPAGGEFLFAISHVFSAENTELEHSFWRKLWRKPPAEAPTHRFRAEINVVRLHFVAHFDQCGFHLDAVKKGLLASSMPIRDRLGLHQNYANRRHRGWRIVV